MINAYTANVKIFLTLLKSTKGKPSVGWHCIKLALLNLIGGLCGEGTDKDIILLCDSFFAMGTSEGIQSTYILLLGSVYNLVELKHAKDCQGDILPNKLIVSFSLSA